MELITAYSASVATTYEMGKAAVASANVAVVTIDTQYEMGKYAVLASEYADVYKWAVGNGYTMGEGYDAGKGLGKYPVVGVSWFDAVLFCNGLSEFERLDPCYMDAKGGVYRADVVSTVRSKSVHEWPVLNIKANGYRLPTEAEWEFAARNGGAVDGDKLSGCRYANVPCFDEACPYCTEKWELLSEDMEGGQVYGRVKQLAECGLREANALGYFDMLGNILEWTYDAWREKAVDKELDKTDHTNVYRVVKGAAFGVSDVDMKLGSRQACNAEFRMNHLGFRVGRTMGAK